MQQSQSIICYQLVNAPTSLVDDIITYKSFVQRKRSSEAPCSSAATAAPCFPFSSKICLLRGFYWLAGGAHIIMSSALQWSSRTVPGFLVPIGETLSLSLSLSAQLYTELAAPVHVRVGPLFCLMINFKCLVGGWFRTNYIIFRNAEIFLFK
jgi:hypothetical protein